MEPQAYLFLFLIVVAPVAWLISEFQQRAWLRIFLGVLSISMSFLLASLIGMLQHLNYNSSYGTASARLLDTTIAELETGRPDRLLQALRQLRGEFSPTYENRANYDQLVDRFAGQLRAKAPDGDGRETNATENRNKGSKDHVNDQ